MSHRCEDDQPRARFYLGDATWHDGPGWYYVDDEYEHEGSCGAFKTRDEAEEHAREAGYFVIAGTFGRRPPGAAVRGAP